MVVYDIIQTPMGWFAVAVERGRVRRVCAGEPDRAVLLNSLRERFPGCSRDIGACRVMAAFLERYFARGADARPPGGGDPGKATAFQRAVWMETALIPFGQVRTYGWIAHRLGRTGAARAVGSALGANPLPIIIPCHRVVCANGGLGGFSAAGGVELKRRLLEHEGFTFDENSRLVGMKSGDRSLG